MNDHENRFEVINSQKKISLDIIINQISSFDNKASIIVSILGIVFALSFTVIEIITLKDNQVKPYIFVSFLLFIFSTIAALLFSVLVLFPRSRKGKNSQRSLTYYMDLKDMTNDEYFQIFLKDNECGINIEQINQNAQICAQKHKLLQVSITLLIPMSFFFLLTTILIVWL